jgi:PIN domain nuclease of toxin-antitoxin system
MLVAQTKVEGLVLMTADQRLHAYDVPILRC